MTAISSMPLMSMNAVVAACLEAFAACNYGILVCCNSAQIGQCPVASNVEESYKRQGC